MKIVYKKLIIICALGILPVHGAALRSITLQAMRNPVVAQQARTFFSRAMAQQGLNNAKQVVTRYSINKIKEDPKAAVGAGIGAGAGFVLSGDGVIKTTTGTFLGAFAGYKIAKNGQDIRSIKKDVSWLRKHAATEDGLAKSTRELRLAIENLRQFTGDKFDRLRVTLKALARAGERRAQGIEERVTKSVQQTGESISQRVEDSHTSLSGQMKQGFKDMEKGFEHNTLLHNLTAARIKSCISDLKSVFFSK